MSLDERFDEDELKLVITVSCDDIQSTDAITRSFDDIDVALNRILEKARDEEIYFFSLILQADGVEPAPGNYDPYSEDGISLGEVNPWQSFCPMFWDAACQSDETRARVDQFATKLVSVVERVSTFGRSTESLWEDDETQFGEPVLSHLALADRAFVPFYTRMLQAWDLGHEVEQNGAIVEMIEAHGSCAEIEDLLYARALLAPGQAPTDAIEAAFETLQAQYGDFTQSSLFRRMVATSYAQNVVHKGIDKTPGDSLVFDSTGEGALVEASKRIRSELDAVFGLSTSPDQE